MVEDMMKCKSWPQAPYALKQHFSRSLTRRSYRKKDPVNHEYVDIMPQEEAWLKLADR
jgi:hypothetical protein